MKYAVDSKEMKKIDHYAVEVLKIPATVLMERAAKEIVAVMKKQINKADRILAVCGPGNNGGDGIAAGRILYIQGYHVAILFIGEEDKASEQTRTQLDIAHNLGITIENYNKLHEYNVIIDAIFGVGLSRPISGEYEVIINEINKNDNLVFAVDVPSGISADNGCLMNTAIKADYTITFGFQKQGLLLYPGAEFAGKITIADIGFPEIAAKQAGLNTFYYEPEDVKRLPARKNYSNKGTYGKVLIIAGSKGMSGAAYLCAKAAYRTGAGLVKVLTSAANRIIIQTTLPEALFAAYDEMGISLEESKQKLQEDLSWASVIVIGPGLGQSQMAVDLLDLVIKNTKVPIIIDADGITLLSKRLDLQSQIMQNLSTQSRINYLRELLSEQTILTPHLKELSRLLGITISDISNNLIDTASQCSYNNKLIYAIKDARTIVSQHQNRYINVSGNNGMATGGSGDALTGIIAALIAQGKQPYEATCLGVYLHGLAGDTVAREKGTYSLMASDIVNSIEKVIMTKEFV